MAFKGNGTSAFLQSGNLTSPAAWTYHFFYKGTNAPSSGDNQRLLSVYSSGTTVDFGFLWDNTANKQSAFMRNGSMSYFFAALTSTLSSNTWYPIGGRLGTGFNLDVYLNGVSQNTTACGSGSPTSPATSNATLLAAYGGTTEYNPGTIAEVGIWNVPLNDNEMVALGNGVCPLLIRPLSLISYAPLVADLNARLGVGYSNTGCSVQQHCRIIYPDIGDERRITALTAGHGSLTRNVNLASSFIGSTPGFASESRNVNFQSRFATQNIVKRNVNFASAFTVPAPRASFADRLSFRSRFTCSIGALASGRFRGHFYG